MFIRFLLENKFCKKLISLKVPGITFLQNLKEDYHFSTFA